jgi:hypothetical protein
MCGFVPAAYQGSRALTAQAEKVRSSHQSAHFPVQPSNLPSNLFEVGLFQTG